MYGKKTFLVFVFLFLLGDALFSGDFDIEDLNGVWLTPSQLNSYLSNSWDRGVVYHGLLEGWVIFHWNKTSKEGVFYRGVDRDTILSVEVVEKRVTIKYLYGDRGEKREIVLEYVSRDLLRIISSPNYYPSDYLCRISDFARKSQAKGKINNYGVRLRNKPELGNGAWFYLDFEEEVEILGISEEKQTIGELEAYWYEVRINISEPFFKGNDVLDGWVFGAYLDIENRTELEEKLKKLRRDGG